jgi:hypothetical protein
MQVSNSKYAPSPLPVVCRVAPNSQVASVNASCNILLAQSRLEAFVDLYLDLRLGFFRLGRTRREDTVGISQSGTDVLLGQNRHCQHIRRVRSPLQRTCPAGIPQRR